MNKDCVVLSFLSVFKYVAATVGPSDEGMCDISSCYHCDDTSTLRQLVGVQVRYHM